MKKVLIWGIGKDYDESLAFLKYFEAVGEMQIIGLTSNDTYLKSLDGYRFYNKSEILHLEYDYVIICTEKLYQEIETEAIGMGISEKKILSVAALRIPGFRFEKYMALKNSHLTIIANNCWGGITYNYLKLKFESPLINMFFDDDKEYIAMLKDLEHKLKQPIKLVATRYETQLKFDYPIFDLDGCKIYMNHYSDIQDAEAKWYERRKRINWNNIFVMMYTSSHESAEEFDKLPFGNKVCFVPFKTDLNSALYMPMAAEEPLWSVVNKCAASVYKGYDVFDLLAGKRRLTDRAEIILEH